MDALGEASAKGPREVSRLSRALLLAAVLFPAAPAFAHHSFAAYESDKTLTLTATIETFEWRIRMPCSRY